MVIRHPFFSLGKLWLIVAEYCSRNMCVHRQGMGGGGSETRERFLMLIFLLCIYAVIPFFFFFNYNTYLIYKQVRLPSMDGRVALVPWADMLNHSCEVRQLC